MKLFNLTDRLAPGQARLYPQTLKRMGVVIEPGGFVEVPDDFRIGLISGWVNSGLVSADRVPDWYANQRNEEKRAKISARNESLSVDGESKPSKKSRKSKKRGK